MSLQGKRNTILSFITARSPQGLRRLILIQEARDGFLYDWDIHRDKDQWIAYYRKQIIPNDDTLAEFENDKAIEEKSKGSN